MPIAMPYRDIPSIRPNVPFPLGPTARVSCPQHVMTTVSVMATWCVGWPPQLDNSECDGDLVCGLAEAHFMSTMLLLWAVCVATGLQNRGGGPPPRR